MGTLHEQFTKFIQGRKYLKNVSAKTAEWYEQSFQWLDNPDPTDSDLKQFVIRMRQVGLKAASCNNRIRAVNAYLHWHADDSVPKCGAGCRHLRVPKLREEQRVLPVYKTDDVQNVMSFKPKTWYERRLMVLILTLADCGCRIDEALSLKWDDVDFDNLLLTLHGKGSKDRKVPFSFELRRHLFKFKQKHEHQRVFSTKRGEKWGQRNCYRDVKRLCTRVGIHAPERLLHSFRHTMASNYIRRGGSVAMLQRVLGHTTLQMTMRYVHIQTEDLSKNHERITLLGR